MYALGPIIIILFLLFFLFISIAIPVLVIILLIKAIRNTEKKKFNDCKNCPYRSDIVFIREQE